MKQRSMWKRLECAAVKSGNAEFPEAICVNLESGGHEYVVVLMGRKDMSPIEIINALRASAEFIALDVGAELGECRPITDEDFPKGKKEIN